MWPLQHRGGLIFVEQREAHDEPEYGAAQPCTRPEDQAMTALSIRNAVASDFERIIRINDGEVHHTSPLDVDRLRLIDGWCAYHKVALVDTHVAAFLLAIRSGAPYQNDNFTWFSRRLSDFLYVDRIVVSAAFSGRRIGSTLYDDMFAYARSRGITNIVCEYNIEPPNPGSRAFHDRFGFKELGTQWVAGGTKLVSLQGAKT